MPSIRSLLKKEAILVPGVYDCLTALLAEDAGFKAVYLTGAGLSVSFLGKPDVGHLTLEDIASNARRIAGAVGIPLLVDADTGFGGPAGVVRTVRALEKAGAGGVQIEDQVPRKRCGHLKGKAVVPAREMIQKIRAAVQARRDRNFVVVARTDARGALGFQEALRRAEAYKRAGADVIFPEALESLDEFRVFGRKKILGTLMVNMTEFGLSPALSALDLARLGYRLILYPMTAFRVGAFAMRDALRKLKKKGQTRQLLHQMQTRRELYKLIGYNPK